MKVIIFVFLLATIASITATTLNCRFTRNTIFGYVCGISGIELVAGDETIKHADHLEGKTDADLKMVTFAKTTVKGVPNQIFTIFPNLEILDLVDVKMTKWNRDFIKNAKNLKRIWLQQNEITELGDNSFLGAVGLENLVLHNNKIEKISDKAFNGLLQLKSLELRNNFITSLSEHVFAPLKKLKELNLNDNKIQNINGHAFRANSKLEFLNFDKNNLTDLPASLFMNQPNLTVLYLQNNQITKLSKELFTGCIALMELRLDNNEIKEIPKGIFQNNKKFKLLNIMNNLVETFDGKVLPDGMELLYIDENVTTQHMPEKLEIFRAEKPGDTQWTQPETPEFTTADK